jgi:hypothetical protein
MDDKVGTGKKFRMEKPDNPLNVKWHLDPVKWKDLRA